jgi:hypothetical protein
MIPINKLTAKHVIIFIGEGETLNSFRASISKKN